MSPKRSLSSRRSRWKTLIYLGFASISFLSADPVNLSWTDNSDNESGFEIQRLIEGGEFQRIGIVAGNVTSFTDRTADPNLSYAYRVRAFNHFGRSGFTNESMRSATAQGGGDDPQDPPIDEPRPSLSPLQTITNPSQSGFSGVSIDAIDFDFTQTSIAGFSTESDEPHPILVRIAPKPEALDPSIATWKANANLDFTGSSKDWRFSDRVIEISETIRQFDLTPPSPFIDPAMLLEATSGEHFAVLEDTRSQSSIGWYELLSSDQSAENSALQNIYAIGEVGAAEGGIAITFRVEGTEARRATFYAATPEFALEGTTPGILEPQLNVYSSDLGIQYHNIADFQPLVEDSELPLFAPAAEDRIAALQVVLSPGTYTAVAYSISGTESTGVLALSIQD